MGAQAQFPGCFSRSATFAEHANIYGADTDILFFYYTTRIPVCQTSFYNFRTKTLYTNIPDFRDFHEKIFVF